MRFASLRCPKVELGSRRCWCTYGQRRRRGLRELGIIHWNVLLHLLDLDGESVAGARECPTERHLHAIRFAIIRIVDLRWVAAKRSFGVPDEAQQPPRLLVQA